MKIGQLNVNDLIEILKRDFDGDEPVWCRVNDDPDTCYQELWEKEVQRGGVCITDESDIETVGQCIIGAVSR